MTSLAIRHENTAIRLFTDMHTTNQTRKRQLAFHMFSEISRPQKIRYINSTLPQHLKSSEKEHCYVNKCQDNVKHSICPQTLLTSELKSRGINVTTRPSLSVNDFFIHPTKDQMDAYGNDVIQAIRKRDIEELRRMHKEGRSLQSCNRFGESLIHMACRRGFTEVVSFLIRDAGVSVRVRDDYGRTPLHDACWTCEPNLELMDLLIEEEPELLLMSDKRGHTPLQYVRKEHWDAWTEFIKKKCKALRLNGGSL